MHLFECGDRDRGDLHLPSLKSLILFMSGDQAGEEIPGKEAGEAIYGEEKNTVREHGLCLHVCPEDAHLSAINLEFTPLDAFWSENSLKLSTNEVSVRILFWDIDLNLISPM